MTRAMMQLARDGPREPLRMVRVAVPDYLRFGVASTIVMFDALTNYPSLERLLELSVPTLVVIGDRDPLMPDPERVREIAAQTDNQVLIVRMEGAAHAINFSEPDELARLIKRFMADRPIAPDPDRGTSTRSYELHRGRHLPPTGD
jgi:pimeloyl-ACP methyl ester carboxylesterase